MFTTSTSSFGVRNLTHTAPNHLNKNFVHCGHPVQGRKNMKEQKPAKVALYTSHQGAKLDSSQKKQRQTKLQTKSSVVTKYLMAISILKISRNQALPCQTCHFIPLNLPSNGSITLSWRTCCNSWPAPRTNSQPANGKKCARRALDEDLQNQKTNGIDQRGPQMNPWKNNSRQIG